MKTRTITICRIRIAALWLGFVIAANILIFHVVKGQVYNQARDDLIDQARIVTGHISSVVENDINTRIGKDLAREKMKALTFVLSRTKDLKEAEDFIDGYAEAAGLDIITIYDSDGKMVYTTPGKDPIQEDEQVVRMFLDARREAVENDLPLDDESVYDVYNSFYSGNLEEFFNHSKREDENERDCFHSIGAEWLVFGRYRPAVSQLYVEEYFDWIHVLDHITIGESGFVMTVTKDDHIVKSFGGNTELEGQPVDSLSVLLPGRKAVTGEELWEAFEDPKQVLTIDVAERKYLAARLDVPDILMLALRPVEEINRQISNDTIRLLSLSALIFGLFALYAFFQVETVPAEDAAVQGKKQVFRNRQLAERCC